jgi:hypothetical protein
MEKTKQATKKSAASVAKRSRSVLDTAERAKGLEFSGGLQISALGPGELLVRDHGGEVKKLLPKESGSIRPLPVQGASKVKAPVPGLTMAAPASVLWVELESTKKDVCSFILDPTELERHGARWGRPVLLAYRVGGKDTKSAIWQTVTSRTEMKLAEGEGLLLVGVGHGLYFDLPEIFSTLFATRKGEPDAVE